MYRLFHCSRFNTVLLSYQLLCRSFFDFLNSGFVKSWIVPSTFRVFVIARISPKTFLTLQSPDGGTRFVTQLSSRNRFDVHGTVHRYVFLTNKMLPLAWVSWHEIANSPTLAVAASKLDVYQMLYVQFELLMMGAKTA
jgi:hypothetical protein